MTLQLESDQAHKSISIGEALSEAFSPLFSNLKAAFKFAILPSITMVFIVAISLFLMPTPEGSAETLQPEFTLGFFIGEIAIFALVLLVFFQFYAAWVRFIHKDESSIASTFILNLKKRHFILLGKGFVFWIATYLALLIISLIIGLISYFLITAIREIDFQGMESAQETMIAIGILTIPLVLCLLAISSIFVLRFFYIFPAAALGESYGFLTSWKHTRKQSLRLFASFFILSIIITLGMGILFLVVAGIFSTFLFSSDAFTTLENPIEVLSSPAILLSIIPVYFGIIILSMVSYIPFINMHNYCFRTNTGWQNDEQIAERFS